MTRPSEVTVPQVARQLGIELSPEQAWSIGARVRERYRLQNNGRYPPKRNATKTCGAGSHCFAHYPCTFAQDIVAEIRAVTAHGGQLQLGLDDDADL